MPNIATQEEEEIESTKEHINNAITQARLRFEMIVDNHLFSELMSRSEQQGGFPALHYLELLFSHAARETQGGTYNYPILYQLIEVLSYFIYHCKIIVDAESEARAFLPEQNANVRIQVKLALEMLPKNLETLRNNTRLLLAYVTNLEQSLSSVPTYKDYPRLFQVEKLIFASQPLAEIEGFKQAYDQIEPS